MLKIGNRAFTLVEVMATTAVLSLGTVLIYEAFFSSLDSFNYCSNVLNVIPWMDEKLWQTQDSSNRLGISSSETQGEFVQGNKKFTWELSYDLLEEMESFDLYKINLALSWQESQRKIKLLRTAYTEYAKKKEQ